MNPSVVEMKEPMIRIEDLRVWFSARTRFLDRLGKRPRSYIRAVDGIKFEIRCGETLALVGESGSGKTTVARALMGLLREARGEIWFEGRNVMASARAVRNRVRTKMQMIFQDPFDAMNPRETLFEIVGEPLVIHRKDLGRDERWRLVSKALADVGLSPPDDFLHRYPHELSGGQRQRVLIAGALILDPRLIIADEPVSMLDASLKVEILNLLNQLRNKRALTYLLITHDLALTRYVADRIAIIYLGRIVEMGPTRLVLGDPYHPYTRALIDVIPTLDRAWEKKEVLRGEIPHPTDLPEGCRFGPRCPEAGEPCSQKSPVLQNVGNGRLLACHLRRI